MKTTDPNAKCPEDSSILESAVADKLAQSYGGLSRAQAIQILQTQRDHDAALAASTAAAEAETSAPDETAGAESGDTETAKKKGKK